MNEGWTAEQRAWLSQRFFGLIRCQVCGNMSENRGRRSSCRVCASSAPEIDMLSGMSDVSPRLRLLRVSADAQEWRHVGALGS